MSKHLATVERKKNPFNRKKSPAERTSAPNGWAEMRKMGERGEVGRKEKKRERERERGHSWLTVALISTQLIPRITKTIR